MISKMKIVNGLANRLETFFDQRGLIYSCNLNAVNKFLTLRY